MDKNKTYIGLHIITEMVLLSIFWALITLDLSMKNIIFGLFIGGISSLLSYKIFGLKYSYAYSIKDILKTIISILSLIFSIYKSAFTLAYIILFKKHQGIIVRQEHATEKMYDIVRESNAITLTPGTITVRVKENHLVVLTYEKI